MTDPNTTPADGQTATLLVDRTSSTCGGCGARFASIRSANRSVTEEDLRSLRPDLPVNQTQEQQMTDRPYTDDDLRAEAARLHANAAKDPDEGLVAELMERGHVPSVETSEDGSARTWPELLEPDGEETEEYAEAAREVCDLITGAADTSRWAVDLGADQLQPGTRAIDIGWNNGPLMARIHIAYAASMPDDEREQLVTDLSDAIAGTVPVR